MDLWFDLEHVGEVQQRKRSSTCQYCNINKKQKKTIREMGHEFLRAFQSLYRGQKAILSNEEFNNLKEEQGPHGLLVCCPRALFLLIFLANPSFHTSVHCPSRSSKLLFAHSFWSLLLSSPALFESRYVCQHLYILFG